MVGSDTTPLHGPGSKPVTDANFAAHLVAVRKQRGLTQQAIAEHSGAHVTQIRSYEADTGAPTLDVLRNLALALNTSADSLLFDSTARGAETPSLRLHLEAFDQLDPDEQATVRAVIEGAPLHHQVRQLNVG